MYKITIDVIEGKAPEITRDRECEVLVLLVEGKTDKEIAKALGIAESTAKNHVGNILDKLNVPNRAAAVAAAYELNLIPRSP